MDTRKSAKDLFLEVFSGMSPEEKTSFKAFAEELGLALKGVTKMNSIPSATPAR